MKNIHLTCLNVSMAVTNNLCIPVLNLNDHGGGGIGGLCSFEKKKV